MPGVLSVSSPNPGPVVGITILTHGNEPAGLAAAWYFLTQLPLQKLLLRGTVTFIINNLEASRRYLEASDDTLRRACRYVDVNMNRLPRRDLSGSTCEERRSRELLPVWQRLHYAMDIHSTIQDSRPMVVLGRGPETAMLAGQLGIPTLVGNMLGIQSGFPALHFYGDGSTSTLGIEVGSHTHPESMRRAIHATAVFMTACGVLPGILALPRQKTEHYDVYGKLILTHPEGALAKVFRDFEPYRKGDLLAREPGKEHRADRGGCTLFGPPQTKVIYPGEEMLFLLRPLAEGG